MIGMIWLPLIWLIRAAGWLVGRSPEQKRIERDNPGIRMGNGYYFPATPENDDEAGA